MAQSTLPEVETQLRSIIQNLYILISQTSSHAGQPTATASAHELSSLITNLSKLSRSAPGLNIEVPPEAFSNIQGGRNPDIYTREMIETVMRYNQQLKGRSEAFAAFRDRFAVHLATGAPQLKGEVKRVVEATGGVFDEETLVKKEEGG